jgi:lipase
VTEPEQRTLRVHGVDLCYFEWSGRGGPTLLLAHATGFHARVWDRVIAALPAPWDAARIIALETRGHGRSAKQGPYDWLTCGDDLIAFLDALDIRDLTIAGHSMGGHLAVLAAAARPERIARLVLIDPVIPPPPAEVRSGPMMDPKQHPVARRRNAWENWEQMVAHFADREPYGLWDPVVLADYCRHGLLPNPDGPGFVLACPPIVEATFYSHSPFMSDHIYRRLGGVEQPVLVVRARRKPDGARAPMDFSNSPTWPDLAGAFPHGDDLHLADLTHFIPMQAPALTARLIADGRAP